MSIDSRERILVEAERRFAEAGLAGTSLSSIATAAGLGNAGLLHHFRSKAALYRAVLEAIATDLDARNAVTLAESDDPVDRLTGLVDNLLALNRDRPTALMIITREFLDRSGRIEGAGVLPLAGVVRDTVAVVHAGQQHRQMRPGDPLAITAALHGALLHGMLGRIVYERTEGARDSPPSHEDWESEIASAALSAVLLPQHGVTQH